MHKSAPPPSKIGTCLKSDNHTSNDSVDPDKNHEQPNKENMLKTSKVAVIDIERENRLSKKLVICDRILYKPIPP